MGSDGLGFESASAKLEAHQMHKTRAVVRDEYPQLASTRLVFGGTSGGTWFVNFGQNLADAVAPIFAYLIDAARLGIS